MLHAIVVHDAAMLHGNWMWVQRCAPLCKQWQHSAFSVLADHQHARLVKYYTYFGFEKVKVVGENGLQDLPDQVVWGGVGTRMDAVLPTMLQKWSPALLQRWQHLQSEAPAD